MCDIGLKRIEVSPFTPIYTLLEIPVMSEMFLTFCCCLVSYKIIFALIDVLFVPSICFVVYDNIIIPVSYSKSSALLYGKYSPGEKVTI